MVFVKSRLDELVDRIVVGFSPTSLEMRDKRRAVVVVAEAYEAQAVRRAVFLDGSEEGIRETPAPKVPHQISEVDEPFMSKCLMNRREVAASVAFHFEPVKLKMLLRLILVPPQIDQCQIGTRPSPGPDRA